MCPCARFAWPSTLPLLRWLFVGERQNTFQAGLIWCGKNVLIELLSLSKTCSQLEHSNSNYLVFSHVFHDFFAGCGINSLVFLPLTRQVLSWCTMRFLFLKKKCWFPNCCQISWDVTCVNHLKIHCEQCPCVAKHAWKRGCRAEAPSWSASLEVNEITFFEGFANIRGFLELSSLWRWTVMSNYSLNYYRINSIIQLLIVLCRKYLVAV